MAETIVLNGVFKDDITPQLKKLTRSIDQLQKSFKKFGKSLRPIARDLGKVAAASERINMALKDQTKQTIAASKAWAVYRREVGKAGGAQRKAFRGVARGPVGPSAARGRGGAGLGAAVTGAGIGMTIGRFAEQGITAGFRIGAKILMTPFEYLAKAFVERMDDEMADIFSAGGMFANDRRYNTGLFSNFAEARGFQEQLNRRLATSAAALPGETNEFVRAARQITDTIGIAFGKNPQAFNDLARSMGGTGESLDSLATIIQNFTEKAVLLGKADGGRGSGTMGLPMLLEQLVNMDQVNVRGLQRRYAALRGNPGLAAALDAAQAEINATGANTAERLRVIMRVLDEALPESVIAAMKTSMRGVTEAIRSAFMDPDSGLFGLSRELKLSLPKIDQFGRFVDKNGKVVATAGEAVQEATTLYKLFREVVGGFLIPFQELIPLVYELFDPLNDLAEAFVELREIATRFMMNFNQYTKFFKEAELDQPGVRGALAAINKLLLDLGIISAEAANLNLDSIEDPTSTLSKVFGNLMSTLMNSEFMAKVGFALGQGIGSIFAAIAQVMAGVKDNVGSGPFGKGFAEGFASVGGSKAMRDVFMMVFETIGSLLMDAVKSNPDVAITLGAVVLAPAVIGGVVTAITGAIIAALAPIATALAPFAAVVALFLGAIFGLASIFRHLDFITSSLYEAFMWLANGIELVFAKIEVAILEWLNSLPIIGGRFDEQLEDARERVTAAEEKMAANVAQINKNTADSFARTASDWEKLTGSFMSWIGGGNKEETGQKAPLVTATKEGTVEALNTASSVTQINKALTAVSEGAKKEGETTRAKITATNTELAGINGKLSAPLQVDVVKSVAIPMELAGITTGTGDKQGGPSVFNGLAQGMGLMMTSGYRPNDTDSYHGINRARDYAGDPAQMLAFAQMMSSTFGGTLKELIYTPLGYSIKNGSVVPPYAQGTHYDHVHVAYGMGGGNPAFFSSKSAAQAWERRVAPSNSAIASVTSNSSEMGGRSVTVGNINISGVNDPKAIAETVAEEIMVALDRSSYTSLYNS